MRDNVGGCACDGQKMRNHAKRRQGLLLKRVERLLERRLTPKCLRSGSSAGVHHFCKCAWRVTELTPAARDQMMSGVLQYTPIMIFSHFRRKLAATTAALGLIFAQLMVAAYACPMVAMAIEARADIAAEASADVGADIATSSMICDPSSTMQDGLCKAHCQSEQENISALAAPATDFIPAFIVRMPAPQIAQHGAPGAAVNIATLDYSPPILLRNACLRI